MMFSEFSTFHFMFIEGQQIGPYTLIRRLGRGGFGDVWLAERRSHFLTKRVAVKLPHDDQVDFNTIQREAGLWEEASGHPNVLPIIDAEIYDGQVVVVSEYADGGSLADKLSDVGTTTVKEAVDLTIGILNGLEFLHDKRIIHRDIKPQNILLQGNTPRLADFGISRAMATSAVSSTVIGTDAYMSPEAFDGKRTVQTDIWSTGVVLYQLLSGTLPFPQTHPTERMFAVLTKDFEPLSDDVPSDLRQIVASALAKLPENRFASATAMRQALSEARLHTDHLMLAKTEVIERDSIPQVAVLPTAPAADYDPEATIIRVQIPDDQETVARPFFLADQPTHFELVDQTSDRPSIQTKAQTVPSTDTSGNDEAPFVKVLGVAGAIIFGFFLLAVLYGMLPDRPASNPAANRTLAANSSNVPKSSGNYPPSSGNYPSSTRDAGEKGTTFCDGFAYGWRSRWKLEKGDSYAPPPSPPCPDLANIDPRFRNNLGGQSEGNLAASERIRTQNK